MMQYTGESQTLQLTNLEVGQYVDMVITGATAAVTLQFKNLSDDDAAWRVHPALVSGTGTVIITRFKIISPVMRVSFAAAPGAYRLALIYDAVPNF